MNRSNDHLEQKETSAPTWTHGRLLLDSPNNNYAYLKTAWTFGGISVKSYFQDLVV